MPPPDHQAPTALPILVVDDDQATREFIVLLLNLERYQTLQAASGEAALATVAAQPVQAVVLDLRLPDLDGFAVCRQLRATGYAGLPVILITADDTPQLEHQAAAAGVTAVLRKPFLPEALLERLADIVAPTGAERAGYG